jgi:F-type H+-transporting ATPase subunit b
MLNFGVSFLITIVNFVVLYFVLRKLLFKPVTTFMKRRADKVRGDLADAAMMKGKAEELAKRYDGLLAVADAEAERLVKEGEERARDSAKDIVTAAQAEAASLRRQGEEAGQAAREKARKDLVGDIAALAAEVAARMAAREAVAADARAAELIVRELEAGRAR